MGLQKGMKLCHRVILEGKTLSHEVGPIEQKIDGALIFPMKTLSFMPFAISAHMILPILYGEDFVLSQLEVCLDILIVDEQEQRPLLWQSPSRSIFLLGEIIEGLHEGFLTCGFSLKSIAKSSGDGLSIKFLAPEGMMAHAALGGVMALGAIFDFLLFSRGLVIKSCSSSVKVKNRAQDQFLQLFKQLLESYCSV